MSMRSLARMLSSLCPLLVFGVFLGAGLAEANTVAARIRAARNVTFADIFTPCIRARLSARRPGNTPPRGNVRFTIPRDLGGHQKGILCRFAAISARSHREPKRLGRPSPSF